MAALTDEQANLFLEPNYGVAATLRRDGSPHLTTVWVDWDGEQAVFNTNDARVKAKHLRRDPRASLIVIHRDDPYKWVSVAGRAEVTADGAVEHINKLAKKYRGRDTYDLKPGETRLIVRIRPERVTVYGV